MKLASSSWMQTCTSSDIRRCALVIATLTSFLPPFMASSINIALPAIGAEFSMDAILLGWIATSYLLSAAVFMVPFGKIADIYGMKKVFFIGLFIFTASSLIAFFAPTSSILIGSRILQGIGSAMIFGTGTAILVSVFPVQERGKILGINAASVYLGLSLGPFLGGLLTEYFGWRSLFLINVPLGLIPLALGMWTNTVALSLPAFLESDTMTLSLSPQPSRIHTGISFPEDAGALLP